MDLTVGAGYPDEASSPGRRLAAAMGGISKFFNFLRRFSLEMKKIGLLAILLLLVTAGLAYAELEGAEPPQGQEPLLLDAPFRLRLDF